jgi:hypothetical protein
MERGCLLGRIQILLRRHDGRQRVRRLRGKQRNPAYSVERHVARTVGVMVRGVICYGSRSPLIFIQGSMTVRRYIQEVLQPVPVSYIQDISNALYHQNNALSHIANLSLEHLEHIKCALHYVIYHMILHMSLLHRIRLHYMTCFLAFSVTENNKRQNF